MKCTNCGTEVADSAKFCPECGQKIERKKFCPGCGAEVNGGKFCPECGTPLTGETPKKVVNEEVLDEDKQLDELLKGFDNLAVAKTAQEEKSAEHNKKIRSARSYAIRGMYSEAKEIYDELIEDDPEDMDAYLGYIRLATKNYTIYEGEEIENNIRVAKQISGAEDLSQFDADYASFESARKQYFTEKAEKERKEKERLAEEKRKEQERKEQERKETERKEQERKERERKEQERREQERREQERKEQERKEQERKEAERREQERKEQERKEVERKEQERREQERKIAEYNKNIKTARTYVIMEKYAEAKKLYDGLLNNNPDDMQIYMGYIRLATKNYTAYEGEEIENNIRIAKQISSVEDLSQFDADYAAYVKKRKQYFTEKAEEERKEKERLAEEKCKAILNIGDYKDLDNGYITFGTYPQSKKSGNVKIGEKIDKEHGYYLGSDNSLYEKYNNEYYKVEPIKWKVLSRDNEKFIVADDILDAQYFDDDSNDCIDGEIRSWFNGEFYNKAFNDNQKNKIATTVDNSLVNTCDKKKNYVCGNTSDKVFLLSHKEANRHLKSDEICKRVPTEYAVARKEQERKERERKEQERREQERKEQERKEAELRERERKEQKRIAEEKLEAELNIIGDYKDLGNGYITFGTYPQSEKAGNIKIGKVYDKERGYYLGSDNSLYEEYNNKYYKVEPIKWKILSRDNEVFIVVDDILDAHRFDKLSNNYANSEIRSWLNGEFYNKAFNDGQKSKIGTTTVDNSRASTGDIKNRYVCGNTSDKVFLLSRKEAERHLKSDEIRKRVPTEYAVARGAYHYKDNDNKYKRNGKGCGWWRLRSPYHFYRDEVQSVDLSGGFNHGPVEGDKTAVVPALKIKP